MVQSLTIAQSEWVEQMQHKLMIRWIDKSQYDEINLDLRTSGFDNEAVIVHTCSVWCKDNDVFP